MKKTHLYKKIVNKIVNTIILSLVLIPSVTHAQWTTNGDHIYNTNTDNVGIGESSPAAKLTVHGTTNGVATLLLGGADVASHNDSGGINFALGWNDSGNRQMWFGDSDFYGNDSYTYLRYVFVGSQLPILDAVSANGTYRRGLQLGTDDLYGSSKIAVGNGALENTDTIPSNLTVYTLNNSALEVVGNGLSGSNPNLFSISGNKASYVKGDVFTIKGSGNVGIGTTSPSQKLELNGNFKIKGNIVSDEDICIGTCN